MTQQPNVPSSEVPGDDRLWVLLCFILAPLLPLITLFLEEKKNRPFVKAHTIPTLVLGIGESILIMVLSLIPIVGCIAPLIYIANIVWGLKANKGEVVEIPFVSNFVKSQGWM